VEQRSRYLLVSIGPVQIHVACLKARFFILSAVIHSLLASSAHISGTHAFIEFTVGYLQGVVCRPMSPGA
jgi:hypothetical protein